MIFISISRMAQELPGRGEPLEAVGLVPDDWEGVVGLLHDRRRDVDNLRGARD